MSLQILIVTPDAGLSRYVDVKNVQIVPKGLRRSLSVDISVRSFLFAKEEDRQSLDQVLLSFIGRASAVVIMLDERLARLKTDIEVAFFSVLYPYNLNGKSIHNFFGMVFSPILRTFNVYRSAFADKKYRDILLLPLGNFDASEISTLKGLFHQPDKPAVFAENLQSVLHSLRLRRKPKTFTTKYKMFIVDDKQKYFEHGTEEHKRLEISIGPHTTICVLNGHFRFGVRYDDRKHYNVSIEGRISGDFVYCHGAKKHHEESSHINMFSNDQF